MRMEKIPGKILFVCVGAVGVGFEIEREKLPVTWRAASGSQQRLSGGLWLADVSLVWKFI